jgi:hypothetical protein
MGRQAFGFLGDSSMGRHRSQNRDAASSVFRVDAHICVKPEITATKPNEDAASVLRA